MYHIPSLIVGCATGLGGCIYLSDKHKERNYAAASTVIHKGFVSTATMGTFYTNMYSQLKKPATETQLSSELRKRWNGIIFTTMEYVQKILEDARK
mmetsp:Transcript_19148/g.25227  ORF Transcript_19148/g.25227 Transcript_19148/m.25227 type:complete len:96 (+) Transcript_19148:73-360(+)